MQVKSQLKLAVRKQGKDDLVINKIEIQTEDTEGLTKDYDCKGFMLSSKKNCNVRMTLLIAFKHLKSKFF